jgi:hypothetical protein
MGIFRRYADLTIDVGHLAFINAYRHKSPNEFIALNNELNSRQVNGEVLTKRDEIDAHGVRAAPQLKTPVSLPPKSLVIVEL